MALELHVFFAGGLPSKASLSTTMRQLGLPLNIARANGRLAQHTGFLPIKWRGDEIGVEFDTRHGRQAVEEIAGAKIAVDVRFDRSANMRWGGDENEMLAAQCVAAALAKLTRGVVFDAEAGRLLSVDEAISAARSTLASLTPKEGIPRKPGTRPADIKRYLTPLLKQRDDLVLRGRLLLIRPVRHVLRGLFFDRTSSRTGFKIYEFVGLLGVGVPLVHGRSFYEDVAEPYFQPWLLEKVRDVLERISQVSDLSALPDYVAECWDGTPGEFEQRWRAYALAGERENAETFLAGLSPGWSDYVERARESLARDDASFCAEHHAAQETAARALKLEDAWQPTPFPMELPTNRRAAETSEPRFDMKPWAERPHWLLGEPPVKAGEVAFARRAVMLGGRLQMLVPLTRNEAEAAWENFEDFNVFVRSLAGTPLTLLDDGSHRRYHDESRYTLWVYGDRLLIAGFRSMPGRPGWLWLYGITIEGEATTMRFSMDAEKGDTAINRRTYECRTLTGAEMAACQFPKPAFGKCAEFLSSVNAFLELHGVRSFS
jgi:hypothetical protein